jgi:C_GCAxxG_C_C family probable redox protein
MTRQEAIDKARAYFLTEENTYGCAETTLIVLQEIYGLPNATDSSPAMALNGGVAYSGGICGAIAGAAIAVGRLAAQRIADHKEAKRTARRLIIRLMADFQAEFGACDCRSLIKRDISIPEEHDAFISSGVWRDTCMRQIEFSVGRLHALQDEAVWAQTVRGLAADEVTGT